MGRYVVVENEGRWSFNLCADNGRILTASIIYPSKDACLAGIECMRTTAADATVEDTTVEPLQSESAPKYRIYEDFDGHYFFRYFGADAQDIARSHTYEHKESLLRRIDRTRLESKAPLPSGEGW